MAEPPESQTNLSQSSVAEKKKTHFSLNNMVGILNNESTKQVSFSGGEGNKFVESEINVSYVHKYAAGKEMVSKDSIRDIKDRLEIIFTLEETLTDLLHREKDFTSTISLQLLHPPFSSDSTIEGEIALNELLLADNGCRMSPKRILIMSEAGSGKTTLCHKIAYDWAVERVDNLAIDYQLLVLCNLQKITVSDNLEAALKNLCGETPDDLDLLENVIRCESTNTMIILDGFDHIERQLQNHVLDFIRIVSQAKSSFRRPTILFTCNNRTANASLFQLFQRHVLLSRRSISFPNDCAMTPQSSSSQLPDLCQSTSSKEHPVEKLLKSLQSMNKDDKVYETEVLKLGGLDFVLRAKRTTEKDVKNFFAKFQ